MQLGNKLLGRAQFLSLYRSCNPCAPFPGGWGGWQGMSSFPTCLGANLNKTKCDACSTVTVLCMVGLCIDLPLGQRVG